MRRFLYGNILFCKKNDKKKKFVEENGSVDLLKKKIYKDWLDATSYIIYARKNILLKNLYSIKFPISADYKFIFRFIQRKIKKFLLFHDRIYAV